MLNYESKQLDVFQIWTSQTTDFKHWSKSCFKCRNILEALCPEICARSGVNKLSGKGKITNILDYVGHITSVAATQLCCGNMKAAVDRT